MSSMYPLNETHKDKKRCILSDDLLRFQSTLTKPMKLWTPQEVITWLCDEAHKNGLNHEKIHLSGFHCVDGSTLLKLTQREFVEKAQASGYSLYHIVCRHKRKQLRNFLESRENEQNVKESLLPLNITAVGKKSPLLIEIVDENRNERPVRQWTSEEVAIWMCQEALKYNYDYEYICLSNFHGVDGKTLLTMGENDFIKNVNSSYELGRLLYKSVDELKRSNDTFLDKYRENACGEICTLSSRIQGDEECSSSKPKTKYGRPQVIRRKGREKRKKREQLWMFILNRLKDPEYSHLLCWENQEEGLFRIVDSRKLAELWGTLGGKTGMNYENFSRAMRYYYHKKILVSVSEKLIYQFGPASWGWKPENSAHDYHSERSN